MSQRSDHAMPVRTIMLCWAVVVAVLLGGCGVAHAADGVPEQGHKQANRQAKETPARAREEEKQPQPTCDIFLVSEIEGAAEYQAVYYDRASGAVSALADETCFAKDAGFNRDQVDLIEAEDAFPGVDELSFADVTIEWDDERISYVVRFEGLEDSAHLAELDECGILQIDDVESGLPLDAHSLMDRMIEQGATAVSSDDYEGLAFSEDF